MEIILDLKKTIEQNASDYFEKSKKEKKKAEGARIAVEKAKKKLEVLQAKEALKKSKEEKSKEEKESKAASKKWYHKFRWFITSDDFLVIGGRDATTNEIVIKKHTDKNDVVFHTEMPASPFVVIKTEGKKVSETALKEAGEFTASYSSAWKRGLSSTEVFYVNPDQVSKEAKSGEFIGRGAFMIYGKKQVVNVMMNLAIGMRIVKEQEEEQEEQEEENKEKNQGQMRQSKEIMAGPLSAVKKHCEKTVVIVQGDEKNSDVAKKIQKKIGGELDEIIRVLPQGCTIKN